MGHPSRIRAGMGLVGLFATISGCPGTLEDPARFFEAGLARGDGGEPGEPPPGSDAGAQGAYDGGCADVPDSVFQASCLGMGCHNAQDKAQGLDLQSPGLVARLVGVAATEGAGLLIDPSAPSRSILYEKLEAPPPFGARMPSGSTLDGATIACVLTWITAQVSGPADAGASADGPDRLDGDE